MKPDLPKGPFCQSCGMPMEKPDDFGSNADGFKVNDYCRFCFDKGAFTDPNITMEHMIKRVSVFMSKMNDIPESQAQTMASEFIPRLKRWQ
ncbi:MAG: transcriptional regulator [Proteobacteria bacterium]|nr:transcriptional regulator [Pseudomonadota bacterium]